MKKNKLIIISSIIVIILMIGILLYKYFNEKDNKNKNMQDNPETIQIDNKTIDLNEDTKEAREGKLYQELFALGNDIYSNGDYKKINNKDKEFEVSISELKEKGFDTSSIYEYCLDDCKIENFRIKFDLNNKEYPVSIIEESGNPEVEKILKYVTEIYDSKKYTSLKEDNNVYVMTLGELNTLFGYDISDINCDKDKTVIKFMPNDPDKPILIENCFTSNNEE